MCRARWGLRSASGRFRSQPCPAKTRHAPKRLLPSARRRQLHVPPWRACASGAPARSLGGSANANVRSCEIGKPPPAAFVSLSWPREKAKQLKLKILLLAQLNSWMRRCSQACVLTLGASRARGATPVRGQGGWWEGDGGVASTQFECLCFSRRSKLYTHLPLWQPGIEVLFSGIYWYREDNFCHTL